MHQLSITDDSLEMTTHQYLDGAIVHAARARYSDILRNVGIPYVNTSQAQSNPPKPLVGLDNVAVGRMGAEHLIHKGIRRILISPPRGELGRHRAAGVIAVANEKGAEVIELKKNPGKNWPSKSEIRDQAIELSSFRGPVGHVAFSDFEASGFVQAARVAGLNIPDDLAVVSINNDEVFCESLIPHLSSVALPGREVGSKAAHMLHDLLRGKEIPNSTILLQPSRVVQRQSTDRLNFHDETVNRALAFMRGRYTEGIKVDDVLTAISCSRSTLEKAFRKNLDNTPLQVLHRLRSERAQELLTQTDLSVEEIAENCGFNDTVSLWSVFKKYSGMTPSDFRRTHRA